MQQRCGAGQATPLDAGFVAQLKNVARQAGLAAQKCAPRAARNARFRL
jgi:hypothetical protein